MTIFGRSGRTYLTFFMCVVSDPWKLRFVVSSVIGGSLPGVFQTSVAKSPHSLILSLSLSLSLSHTHTHTWVAFMCWWINSSKPILLRDRKHAVASTGNLASETCLVSTSFRHVVGNSHGESHAVQRSQSYSICSLSFSLESPSQSQSQSQPHRSWSQSQSQSWSLSQSLCKSH